MSAVSLAPAASMPLTFNPLGTSGSNSFTDGVTVSRMGFTPPRPKAASYAKFGPAPIEVTLRMRKTLQPSMSAPTLTVASRVPSGSALPRIHGSPASKRLTFLATSGKAMTMTSGGGGAGATFGSTWPEVGLPTMDVWPRGPSEEATSWTGPGIDPGEGRVAEPWLSMLTGGQHVQLPEDPSNAIKGTERFVGWYKAREMEIQHERDRVCAEEPDHNPVPWADLMRESVGQLHAVEEGSGEWLRKQSHLDVLDRMQEVNALQGLDALGEALMFRFGTPEYMRQTLDFRGNEDMSLMEFSGAMSILGLDVNLLCGVDEHVVFQALASFANDRLDMGGGPDRRGNLGLDDLAKWGQPRGTGRKRVTQSKHGGASQPGSASSLQQFEAELADARRSKAMVKWISISRWMGRAVQRERALRIERLGKGWHPIDANQEEEDDQPSEVLRRTSGIGFNNPKSTPSLRGEVVPGLRADRDRRRRAGSSAADVLHESGAAMRELERSLRGMFNRGASIQMPDGPRLMTQQDVHTFFGDLTLADPSRPQLAGHQVLDMLFEDAVQMQISFTRIRDGLTFWSFKAILNNAVRSLNLGWPGVTEVSLSEDAKDMASRCA